MKRHLTSNRMAGPLRQGEHRVSWASRTTDSSPSSRSSRSPITGRFQSETIPEEPGSPSDMSSPRGASNVFFSPTEQRLVDESPQPGTTPEFQSRKGNTNAYDLTTKPVPLNRNFQSAPAELGNPRQKPSMKTPVVKHSLDTRIRRATRQEGADRTFELDRTAPIRAMRSNQATDDDGEGTGGSSLHAVLEEEGLGDDGGAREAAREEAWGESFKIEWLSTERLPFYRTRLIRNPWNHHREVKVSRDGTELEPSVGQTLLEEWHRLAGQPPPAATASTSKRGGGPSKSMPSSPLPSTPP